MKKILFVLLGLSISSFLSIEAKAFSCQKKYCKEMVSCEEAKYQLNVCGFSNLDRDNDGIPCENVCGKGKKKSKSKATTKKAKKSKSKKK